MIYRKQEIAKLDRVKRLKIINSVTGIKPANLIGTRDNYGKTNLAVYSSVVHLGSNPALLGFISRRRTNDAGHTFSNIIENGYYTINHIHPEFIENAHYTSAKFSKSVSEFQRCNLTEEYLNGFKAPYVKESKFKIGMRLKEIIDIKLNNTSFIIGEIESIIIPDEALVNEDVDLEISKGVGISGLNSYYSLKKIGEFPFVRTDNFPNF